MPVHPNGSTQDPVPGLQLAVGAAGDKVMIQIANTILIEPNEARRLAAQIEAAAEKAGSAILIAGTMPLLRVTG